ncbi:MAG: CBS domain-containing protein [Bacilli bacterium]|nr:CBS domain-containing protein [Bacilli bacterium]MDY6430912.1 CBS domain-containing protein [Bacilli bacterium]
MKTKDLLIPKTKVDFLYSDVTIGEAIKKMDKHRYQMIPVIERNSGRYVYSVSAGDILREITSSQTSPLEKPLSTISISRLVVPSKNYSDISELGYLISNQNFVPIVDDSGVFLGIITRQSIINFLLNKYEKANKGA